MIKWMSWLMAAVTGALGLLWKTGPKLSAATTETSEMIDSIFAPVTLVFGAIGLILQLLVSFNRQHIESYLDYLSDKRDCARQLAKAVAYKDTETIREGDLKSTNIPPGTFPLLPFALFPLQDVRTLILSKSIEHGLLTPEDSGEVTPDLVQTYRVEFTPSRFEPPPPPAPKPMTPNEARGLVGCCSVATIVFAGLAAFLWFGLHTRWSIVPLICAVISALGCAGFVSELFKAKRGPPASSATIKNSESASDNEVTEGVSNR